MRAWLLGWLGGLSMIDFEHWRGANNQVIRDEYRSVLMDLKAEHDAEMAGLIQELNTVRSSIPTAAASQPKEAVRVFRNFGEFRAAVERKPIKIERKS